MDHLTYIELSKFNERLELIEELIIKLNEKIENIEKELGYENMESTIEIDEDENENENINNKNDDETEKESVKNEFYEDL